MSFGWRQEVKVYPVHTWQQDNWVERVQAFLDTEDSSARFNWPFPMGVFGTLRQHQGNNPLMHGRSRYSEHSVEGNIVEKHRLAFLPHFYARGLTVGYKQFSTAPFEVFYYSPESWNQMIYSVDCLESFDPQNDYGNSNASYYYRTLAWLRLLPEGYEDRWFPKGRVDLGEYRDMKIDPVNWREFEEVPCWIYSNMQATKSVAKLPDSPIIWPAGSDW